MSIKYQLNNDIIVIDDEYSLDLYVNNQKMHLYPQSQKILRLLIERGLHGWKTPTEIIINCLWPESTVRDKSYNNSIRTCIKLLRSVLGKETIVTENDIGYYLKDKPIIIEQKTAEFSTFNEEDTQLLNTSFSLLNKSESEIFGISFSKYTDEIHKLMEKIEHVDCLLSEIISIYDSANEKLKLACCHVRYSKNEPLNLISVLSYYSQKLETEYGFIKKYRIEKETCQQMLEHLTDSMTLVPAFPSIKNNPLKLIHYDTVEYETISNTTLMLSYKINELKPRLETIFDEINKMDLDLTKGILPKI